MRSHAVWDIAMAMCELGKKKKKKETSQSAGCRAVEVARSRRQPATDRRGQTDDWTYVDWVLNIVMPHCREPQKRKSDNGLSQIASKFRMRDKDGICQPRGTRGPGSVQYRLVYCDIAADTPRRDIARLRVFSTALAAKWQKRHGRVGCRRVPTRAAARFGCGKRKNYCQNASQKRGKEQGSACQNLSTPRPHIVQLTYSSKSISLSLFFRSSLRILQSVRALDCLVAWRLAGLDKPDKSVSEKKNRRGSSES